jgi:glycosyltransferase involved in cell wall biosynthesis
MNLKQPLFSIIIPTYARPRQLSACLQALTRLAYPPHRFEVIVVDDGSENPLKGVVDPFRNQLDVILLSQPNAGPATARNTGASQARGTFLAFTDDDCAPAPDWLKNLAKRFAATPDCAIGGRTLNRLPDNPFSTASQMLIDYLYGYYNSVPNRAQIFASNNLALPADLFRAIEGFDTNFSYAAGEDREFCDRWLHHGYGMIYAPEVVVRHSHFLRIQTFCKQHFNYGRAAFHFHRVRAKRGKKRIRIEPLRFYFDLLRYPFLCMQPRKSILLAMLLLLSQTANAAGFFRNALPGPAKRSMENGKEDTFGAQTVSKT